MRDGSTDGVAVEGSRVRQLRAILPLLAELATPGAGATLERWLAFAGLARRDLSLARLAEGHADALAILDELGRPDLVAGLGAAGVWAAEPARLVARPVGPGWELAGEKPWASGSVELDRALVSALAGDGPRLFLVEVGDLEAVPGSWPSFGMAGTDSATVRFDRVHVDGAHAIGGPGAYVERAGFWHGGCGVAACWLGGAEAVASRLGRAAADGDDSVAAAWGTTRQRLDGAWALLREAAAEIDAAPLARAAAERRARRLRLHVEDAARCALTLTVNALGAGALCLDPGHERRVADLTVYLRQLRVQPEAAAFGRACHVRDAAG